MFYLYRQHSVRKNFEKLVIRNLSLLTFTIVKSVDIVNQMFQDYTCQPTSDCYVLVMLAFIFNLTAVNTRTIVKCNKSNYKL